jgi:mannose-6-phosphate isomerase
VKLSPSRLEQIFSLRPWGVLSLAPLFPDKTDLTEPIGEAWMTGVDCRFANGPFAGKKLGEAWREMDATWTGTSVMREAGFPILVKFLFTDEKLSVQVHPDDEYASRFEKAAGGRGKTEMWYVLRAQPGAEVLAGMRPNVSADQFRRAIEDGTAEQCLETVRMKAGDVVFVPARTAHTIGAGLTLCEIQEYSDLTYRVYDYNRRDAHGNARELHIEKALEVMRFGKQIGGKIEPIRMKNGAVAETYFVACRYFATEKWEFAERITAASSVGHFDLLIFLDGDGDIEWAGERAIYDRAQVWMIPAALGSYHLAPQSPTALLRTYVPADPKEFAQELERRGVERSAALKLVYP